MKRLRYSKVVNIVWKLFYIRYVIQNIPITFDHKLFLSKNMTKTFRKRCWFAFKELLDCCLNDLTIFYIQSSFNEFVYIWLSKMGMNPSLRDEILEDARCGYTFFPFSKNLFNVLLCSWFYYYKCAFHISALANYVLTSLA